MQSIFGTSGIDSGLAKAATIIVATDGSGDTDAIQEGINMLPPGGGVVYVKEGSYNIKKSITFNQSNISLIGAGASTLITSTLAIDMIDIDGYDNCLISDLKIVGDVAAGAQKGILIANSNDSIVRNCWLYNLGNMGMVLLGVRGVFTGNVISGAVVFGIIISASDCTIVNNKISGCGVGLNGDGGMNTCLVANNWIHSNVGYGIGIVGGDDNTITGNMIVNNDSGNTSTYDGIILSAADRNVIVGNRLYDNDRYEINISNNTCDKNIITGNICLGAGHVGAINDAGTNTHPNGASGTSNLALDDLNIIA